MSPRNTELDSFFAKPSQWQAIYNQLRSIMLEFPVGEERKWGKPCYNINGKNSFLIGGFKDFCVLSFFKGALLNDPAGILVQQGPNTRSARVVQLTSPEQVADLAPVLRSYIAEAIEIERAGLSVEKSTELDMPDELRVVFKQHPEFKEAFEALTPGRQRGWCLHYAGAKQSSTRSGRIEKSKDKVFAGKGMNDR